MADRIAVFSSIRLAGLVQATSVNIIEPAVVNASQAAVFYSAVTQVGTTVRAVKSKQSGPALIVAKEDEIFAKNLQRLRRRARRQLFAEHDGLPVTPQKL